MRRRLVVGSTMYIVTPHPNDLYAIDLARKPKPALKWVFRPKPVPAAQGVACCDVVNRGAVHSNGRIFFNTLDGQPIAVDARSGRAAVEWLGAGERVEGTTPACYKPQPRSIVCTAAKRGVFERDI